VALPCGMEDDPQGTHRGHPECVRRASGLPVVEYGQGALGCGEAQDCALTSPEAPFQHPRQDFDRNGCAQTPCVQGHAGRVIPRTNSSGSWRTLARAPGSISNARLIKDLQGPLGTWPTVGCTEIQGASTTNDAFSERDGVRNPVPSIFNLSGECPVRLGG
jgi:hypothetical protein